MKSPLSPRLVTLAAVLACAVGPAIGTPPPKPADESAPAGGATAPSFDLGDAARIEVGKKRFNSTCSAYCHGAEGEGGKTPPFKGNKNFVAADAYKTISEGRRGSDIMPPWGNAFTPEQIWELVAYIQFLSKQPPSQ